MFGAEPTLLGLVEADMGRVPLVYGLYTCTYRPGSAPDGVGAASSVPGLVGVLVGVLLGLPGGW